MSEDRPIGAVSPLFTWRSAIVRSELPSTTKLVALVLSLYMSELGDGCFPSYATLAERSSLGRNTVIAHVRALVEARWLTKEKRRIDVDRHESNVYRATTPFEGGSSGDELPPSSGDALGVVREPNPTAPFIPRKERPSRRRDGEPAKPRKRDPVWDALSSIYGEPTTKTEKTHRGKTVREVSAAIETEFASVGAVDVEKLLRRRAAALRAHWKGEADVTQDALVKHWTLAKRLADTGRPDAPEPVVEKLARWVKQVGIRMEDESDVRVFVEQIAAGDDRLAEEAMVHWRKLRKGVSDGDDAAA